MDSFEQQMLDEIERRYREYELSKKTISFNGENIEEKNENETHQSPVFSNKVRIFDFLLVHL